MMEVEGRTDGLRLGPVILVEPKDLHGDLDSQIFALVHI
jgi:hypothetical protein